MNGSNGSNESQSVQEYRQEFAELKRGFQDLLFANRETAAECSRLICQKAMETAELLTDRVCEETEKDKKKAKIVIDTRVLVKNLAKHKRKVTQTKEDVIRTLERTIKHRQASTTYSSFTSSKRWSDELQNNPLLFESCRFIRQGILDTLSYQAVGLPVWLDHSEWVIAFSIQALSDAIRANSTVRVRLRGASLRHAWKTFSLSTPISERQQARWDTLFPSRQAPAGGDRYLIVLPQVLQVMIQAYDDLCGDSKSAKSFGMDELTSEELQARHQAMDWTDASFERGFVPLEQFPCSTEFFQSPNLAWTPFASSELFQSLYTPPSSLQAKQLFHVRFGNRVDDTPVRNFAAILEEKWSIPTQLTTKKTCWPFLCEGLDLCDIVKDVATAGVGALTPEQLSQMEKRLLEAPVRKTPKRKRSNKGSNNKGSTVSVKKRNQK
jgi:hypothetical protein